MRAALWIALMGMVCGTGSLLAGQPGLPSPVVRVGVDEGESPCELSGGIRRLEDGTLSFPAQPAAGGWGWVTVGSRWQGAR